jgi:heme exporter protein C
MFTFVALWTGALWGKPTWGTWWVWDARLTSELVLLFLYLGYIALRRRHRRPAPRRPAGAAGAGRRGQRADHLLLGAWWNTLHQGASVSLTAAPSMAQTMLTGMLVMTFACWAYAFAAVFTRARGYALERDAGAAWVHEHLETHRKERA